jgi:hypothetical protein
MKKFAFFALLLSLGTFTIGCDKKPATTTPTTPAAPTDTTPPAEPAK